MRSISRPDRGDSPRDLLDYLFTLWSWRRVVLVSTVLATAAVFVVSMLLPRSYRATGSVVLVESQVGETAPPRVGDYQGAQDVIVRVLVNTDNLSTIIRDTPQLRGRTPDELARRIRTQTIAVSPVVEVSYDARTPELAQSVLQRVLEQAVALNARLKTDQLTESREYLRVQLEASEKAATSAAEALATFNRTARLQEARELIKALLEQKGDLLGSVGEARADLASGAAQRVALEKNLEGRSEVVSLSRSILDDPTAQQLARERGAAQVPQLTVKSEELQPGVIETQKLYAEAIGKEAGARAEVDALARQIAQLDRELPARQAELAVKEAEFERLSREYDIAKETYKNFVRRYEEARVLVASRVADLKILNQAVASAAPISPRPLINAVAAAVAAFILSVCVALVADHALRARVRDAGDAARPLERAAGA